MEDNSAFQLFSEEGFEEGEYHIENVGLVYDVDVFDS